MRYFELVTEVQALQRRVWPLNDPTLAPALMGVLDNLLGQLDVFGKAWTISVSGARVF